MMRWRRVVLALTFLAAIAGPALEATFAQGPPSDARDKDLAAALDARDATRAVQLANQALAAPLSLPPGHPASDALGPALGARLPQLLAAGASGAAVSADLNNLGVALALRGWPASAGVAFSGSLLVAERRRAGAAWGSVLDQYGPSANVLRFQYSSSTPNPVVINVDNLARMVKSEVGRQPQGGRGPYEFFNGLLETTEKMPTPNERLRAMAEVFPPVVSRAVNDALSSPAAASPDVQPAFDQAYRAFAQYKGKFVRSLDRRHMQRIATAASQSERWDDRGLYGFDPAARLQPGEVFVDVYQVDLGNDIAGLRREYAAVVVAAPTAGRVPPRRVLSLGPAAQVDESVNNLWDDLDSPSSRNLEALVQRLWRPLAAAMPQGTRRVWLSPDGLLGPVPWQALAVAAAPESSLTVSIVDSGDTIRERRPRPATPSPRVLVAGAPDYGSVAGARFVALQHTADEVAAVEQVVRANGLQPNVIVGRGVDRQRLLQALPARIVHIATHGEFRDAPFRAPLLAVGPWLVLDRELRAAAGPAMPGPMGRPGGLDPAEIQRRMAELVEATQRTGRPPTAEQVQAVMEGARASSTQRALAPLSQAALVLSGANAAGDPFVPGSSAFLSDVDLAALDLSATDLVVLPACNLASSNQSAFQGLMSMQSAVVLAGARGLVASLWPVADRDAVAFMRQFYENLLVRKLPAAEALAATQRAARVDASGRPRSPYYWAGWTFFGEGW
jgi:hypothetical protein